MPPQKPRPRNSDSSEPLFWRCATPPFIEVRSIQDGRDLSYGKHFHEAFSIGIVTNGMSSYVNGRKKERIGGGHVVVMNPGDAHACNPTRDEAWSYRMFYFDAAWLRTIQQESDEHGSTDFQPYSTTSTGDKDLYASLNRLYAVLTSSEETNLEKQCAAIECATQMHRFLTGVSSPIPGHLRLARALEFIRDNYTRSLTLEQICAASHLSPSYLIRAFKQKYGLTPHAYITSCRVEFCRAQLRRGWSIAETATAAGFSDQAHLHRTFKKLVAATPGQFLGSR